MIPYWNTEITLYSRSVSAKGEVSWRASYHRKCFWQKKTMRERIDGAEFKPASIVCRIPQPFPEVNVGDIIICGRVNDVINEYATGKRSTDILKKHAGNAMLVSDVHINRRGFAGLDHLYAGG